MKPAPAIPGDEKRLAVLDALGLLETPAEERFDQITRVTKRLFDVPTALITLVGDDVQWFKSRQGLAVPETARSISFCGHAIQSDEVFVVPNALKDPDFSDNPLVTGEPKIRFYAGQPITVDDERIGTLCVLDSNPRQLRPNQYDSLRCLASWVESEIRLWRFDHSGEGDLNIPLSERKRQIDPVTGDLNEAGLARLEAGNPEGLARIEVTFEAPSGLQDQKTLDAALKATADRLRRAVSGDGMVVALEPFRFLVVQPNSVSRRIKVGDLSSRLGSDSPSDSPYVLPVISIVESA